MDDATHMTNTEHRKQSYKMGFRFAAIIPTLDEKGEMNQSFYTEKEMMETVNQRKAITFGAINKEGYLY